MTNAFVRTWRPRMLGYLDDHVPDLVAELAELVRVPSISGSDEENAVQAALARRLAAIGLDVDHWQIPLEQTMAADGFPGVEVRRREAWGLVGRLAASAGAGGGSAGGGSAGGGSAGGAALMFNAHVDVVPPGDLAAWTRPDPFSGAVTTDGVHGRGSCDMKGGLVAALWAARALAALGVPLHGDLLVACVQGEEDGGLGTFATLARGWRADACVIPEPTSLDLVIATGGALTFRLHVPGRATHASRRAEGVSAIEKFLPVFQALRALEARRNERIDPLMAGWDIAYPIEVGVVRGGDWSSSVPDLLIAEGRYGVALDEPVEHARAEFADAVERACAADPWLRENPVRVEWWGGQFAPGRTRQDAPVVAAVRRAHASVSRRPQGTFGAPYGSDLRLMSGMGGIPTVHYGPGAANLAHAPDEHVPVDEVLTTARGLAMLALELCGPR